MKFACLLLAASAGFAQQRVADFSFRDLDGKTHTYQELKDKLTVVAFISTKCPVSNTYNDRMSAVYKQFAGRGISFLFLNANANEAVAEIAQHARDAGFPFPVYKDVNNVVADLFNAQATPEVFVLDSTGTVRYHGYIDDAQNPARVKNQGLKLAIEALQEGKSVATPQTKAFGCTIKRVRRTS
jgi:peroxiredoxin